MQVDAKMQTQTGKQLCKRAEATVGKTTCAAACKRLQYKKAQYRV
jgi:hypothetical protein